MMNGDEHDIRAVEAAYDAAWNAGDIDALVDCFTDDAIVVNPRGETATGHEEIRSAIGGFLTGEALGSRHSGHVIRLSFPAPDVAVVDGRARLEGGMLPDALEHRFIDVLVRRNDRWKIAHVLAGYDG